MEKMQEVLVLSDHKDRNFGTWHSSSQLKDRINVANFFFLSCFCSFSSSGDFEFIHGNDDMF